MVGHFLDVTAGGTIKDKAKFQEIQNDCSTPGQLYLDALAILSNVLKVTRADWVSAFTPSHPLTGMTIVRLGR